MQHERNFMTQEYGKTDLTYLFVATNKVWWPKKKEHNYFIYLLLQTGAQKPPIRMLQSKQKPIYMIHKRNIDISSFGFPFTESIFRNKINDQTKKLTIDFCHPVNHALFFPTRKRLIRPIHLICGAFNADD